MIHIYYNPHYDKYSETFCSTLLSAKKEKEIRMIAAGVYLEPTLMRSLLFFFLKETTVWAHSAAEHKLTDQNGEHSHIRCHKVNKTNWKEAVI